MIKVFINLSMSFRYLSAGLQWGQEAIDVKAAYLHGIVWTVASIQTTAVLVLKKIEGFWHLSI